MKSSFDKFERLAQNSETVVFVISDSMGNTATDVVRAASEQFKPGLVKIERLSQVKSVDEVKAFLDERLQKDQQTAVFHTIVNLNLRNELRRELDKRNISSIDLIGPTITVLASLTDEEPMNIAGVNRPTDLRYIKRNEAMEYFMNHDDGKNLEDLKDADVVLLGVSRTNKTPLSMYLAFQGYKVANIPLSHGYEVPSILFDLDPSHIFGLVSNTDTLTEVRQRRLGDGAVFVLAGSYANPEDINIEQAEAIKLMTKLECTIINTDNKAVEESASEIIAHLSK